jgi:hypothetical protein
MHSIGSGNWPNVDAAGSSVFNINDPFSGNVPDDWLAPALNGNEISGRERWVEAFEYILPHISVTLFAQMTSYQR